MNNSKNSASPTISKDSQEVRRDKQSYWLTPEEIKEMHEDAKRSLENLMKREKEMLADKG